MQSKLLPKGTYLDFKVLKRLTSRKRNLLTPCRDDFLADLDKYAEVALLEFKFKVIKIHNKISV